MNFIRTPISYSKESLLIVRTLSERIAMIDNFVELIVFTPCGSFVADDGFGFEYWNHEYSNVHFRSFNNGQNGNYASGAHNEVTIKECKESIENSLRIYEPQLKQIGVYIELNSVNSGNDERNVIRSKYEVYVKVTGMLDDGLGTFSPYKKEIRFMMEPTVKKYRI